MSFDDANTFSFDKLNDPEVPGALNGGTIRVASEDDRALPSSKSPRSAGFLGLPPRPTSELLLGWDAFSTLVDTFDGRITLATGDYRVQQHTPPIDSSANSNTVAQVMEMVSPWFVGRVGENQFFWIANSSRAHAIVCF